VTIKLGSEETAGSLTTSEHTAAPGCGGPDCHVHPSLDETFYVLDGKGRSPMARRRSTWRRAASCSSRRRAGGRGRTDQRSRVHAGTLGALRLVGRRL